MVTTSRYLEAPRRLRAFVRAHETSLVVLAALVGTIGGLVVAAMSIAVDALHVLLFNLDRGTSFKPGQDRAAARPSGSEPRRVAAGAGVPAVGAMAAGA